MNETLKRLPHMYLYPGIGWVLFGLLLLTVGEVAAIIVALFVSAGYLYIVWLRIQDMQTSTYWLGFALVILAAAVTDVWMGAALVGLVVASVAGMGEYFISRTKESMIQMRFRELESGMCKREDGLVTSEMPNVELREGDNVHLEEGDAVPADALVTHGVVRISNELLYRGSLPEIRGAGDMVSAGALVTEGAARIEVVRTLEESAIEALVRRGQRARKSRLEFSKIEKFLWKYHTLALFLIALVCAVGGVSLDIVLYLFLCMNPLIVTYVLRVWRSEQADLAESWGVYVDAPAFFKTVLEKKVLVAHKNMYVPLYEPEVELIWTAEFGKKTVWGYLATALQYGSTDSERALFQRSTQEGIMPKQVQTYELVARGLAKVGVTDGEILVGTLTQIADHGIAVPEDLKQAFSDRESLCKYVIVLNKKPIGGLILSWNVTKEIDTALLDRSFALGIRLARDIEFPCERDMCKSITWIASLSEIQDQSLPQIGALETEDEDADVHLYAHTEIATIDAKRLETGRYSVTSLIGLLHFMHMARTMTKLERGFLAFYALLVVLMVSLFLWFNMSIVWVLVLSVLLQALALIAVHITTNQLSHAK